jgi:hypothetical protein
MKMQTAQILMATLFISFAAGNSLAATAINGRVNLATTVRVNQVRAARDSVLHLGSVRLKDSKLGSRLQVNSRVNISGTTSAGKGSQLRIASLELNDTRINDSVDFSTDVDLQNDVTLAKDGEIGIGGVSISSRQFPGAENVANLRFSETNSNFSTSLPFDSTTKVQHNREQSSRDRIKQYAELSKCSYGDKICTASSEWKKLSKKELDKLGFLSDLFDNPDNGFHAELFKNKVTGEYVLGFEGTDEGKDWAKGNVQAINGLLAKQYQDAVILALMVNRQLGGKKLTFTGHSLGGGLASIASMVTGHKAVTFNAAGVNVATVMEAGYVADMSTGEIWNNWKNRNELVTAYHVKNDPLSAVQNPAVIMAPSITLAPVLAPALIAVSAANQAIGRHIELPNSGNISLKKAHGIDPVIDSFTPPGQGVW